MIKLCRRCSQVLNVGILTPPYCFDLLDCLDRVFAQMVEAGDLEPPEPDPPYDVKPDDWDTCPQCGGERSVLVRTDWETGARDREPCNACNATGVGAAPWV